MGGKQSSGPGTQNNPKGIPQEAHGGSNVRGASRTAQTTKSKGNGAQKRQQKKKR